MQHDLTNTACGSKTTHCGLLWSSKLALDSSVSIFYSKKSFNKSTIHSFRFLRKFVRNPYYSRSFKQTLFTYHNCVLQAKLIHVFLRGSANAIKSTYDYLSSIFDRKLVKCILTKLENNSWQFVLLTFMHNNCWYFLGQNMIVKPGKSFANFTSSVIFLSCSLFTIWQSFRCFQKFFANPQATFISIERPSHHIFPALTICSNQFLTSSQHQAKLQQCGITK